jgi:ppGpp synthetase/RelA/SpoT-type nucleotidyltranferase
MSVQLSPHAEEILSAYHEELPILQRLAQKTYDQLNEVLRAQGVEINSIERRVKTEKSLRGKLEIKGGKYNTINDVTDLVGIRVITYYTDDVDKVAAIVKNLFKVDWENSVDKRKLHKLDSFGYNSLHYICHLRNEEGELKNIPFEIQMRTALQHVWSAIEHDIGYKGAVKLPPEFRRQFSRLAGMMELADDEFSRLRTIMSDYRRMLQGLVKSGQLDEVPLSKESFRNYLELQPFMRLNKRIAAVNQAELFPAPFMSYLPLLEDFGFETLGDVQRFVDDNSDDAYQLALSDLAVTDLDILSDTVGLQNLCFVHVVKNGGGVKELKRVYDKIYGTHDDNTSLAEKTLQQTGNILK